MRSTISAHDLRARDAARTERHIHLLKGTKAIAAHVGLSQRDILNLIHKGDFPAFIVGNKMVADTEAIKRWLAAKSLVRILGQ